MLWPAVTSKTSESSYGELPLFHFSYSFGVVTLQYSIILCILLFCFLVIPVKLYKNRVLILVSGNMDPRVKWGVFLYSSLYGDYLTAYLLLGGYFGYIRFNLQLLFCFLLLILFFVLQLYWLKHDSVILLVFFDQKI